MPRASWTLQLLAGLSVVYNRLGGFTETGADALNLQADGQNTASERSLSGARALFDFDGIAVQPRAIWAHEFGDINAGMTAQLQGVPAASFTTYGVALPRKSLLAGVTVGGHGIAGGYAQELVLRPVRASRSPVLPVAGQRPVAGREQCAYDEGCARIAFSTPGKRLSISARRSVFMCIVPVVSVCTSPDSRNTLK